jgi:hypothetical protein
MAANLPPPDIIRALREAARAQGKYVPPTRLESWGEGLLNLGKLIVVCLAIGAAIQLIGSLAKLFIA